MNIRCKVKISETNKDGVENFIKEWAEVSMDKDENRCVEAVVIEISNGCATVKFKNGILLNVPVGNICLLE